MLIIIIIIIIKFYNFTRVYTITHLKKHVSISCNVEAILYLQFMNNAMLFPTIKDLYFHITTFRSVCAPFSIVAWRRAFPISIPHIF